MANETLTAGRELDARIAHAVCGWRWFRRIGGQMGGVRLHVIFPPEGSGYVRNYYAPEFWEEIDYWPTADQRFVDWDRCGYKRESGRVSFLPAYSSDRNAAMDALHTFGSVSIDESWDEENEYRGATVTIFTGLLPNMMYPQGNAEDFCLAACAAILAARQ